MQTLHSVLKRGGLFWNREILPPEVFVERFRRVQAAVVDAGDDAWVVYGDVERFGSAAYVSHFLPRTRSMAVLVPARGDPSLLASVGARDIPASKTLTWIDDVRPFTAFPKEFIKLIEERNLDHGRIGLAGTSDSLPITEWTAIQQGLPGVTWTDRDALLLGLRAQKAPEEVATIERAAGLIDSSLKQAGACLRPGSNLRGLCAEVDRVIRRGGAEDARILVAVGGETLRPPHDRVLQAADVVLLFVAAQYQRYWAEAAQTLVLGQANEAQRALSQRASNAVEALQNAARVGASVGALAKAASGAIGSEQIVREADTYGLGHGLGMDPEEGLIITSSGTDALPANSILGLHVVLRDAGQGAIAGRTIQVSEEGARSLTSNSFMVELTPAD